MRSRILMNHSCIASDTGSMRRIESGEQRVRHRGRVSERVKCVIAQKQLVGRFA